MTAISFTPQQRQAIEMTGRSIIVSAAAGSGKTAVLAERCAYLVCDASLADRCNVDELLVLTFTEAAAAEMRLRIVEALRSRLTDKPNDDRLGEQVALATAAQISTIHSFCLWLVRRWFNQLGIDPTVAVLDADEASLLRSEVVDSLFSDLYATEPPSGCPLGEAGVDTEGVAGSESIDRSPGSSPRRGPQTVEELGKRFLRLVDDYGLGEDRTIARFVLRLFDFTSSLPDPDAWLGEAHLALAERPELIVHVMHDALIVELERQVEHCTRSAADIDDKDGAGLFHASQINAYTEQLRLWIARPQQRRAAHGIDATPSGRNRGDADALEEFEDVRRQIADFEFPKKRAPALPKDADEATVAARDAAAEEYRSVKKLFSDRLKRHFGLFSVEELIAGLTNTAPYVETLVDLVGRFRDRYSRRKRQMSVLDFADLERFAHELLSDSADRRLPSDVARTLHSRFEYVLVDEFQDINPIQQEIIRLLSRESDPRRADNLFVVGDVKQSIYRFRLAEPAIFTERLGAAGEAQKDLAAVFLQTNFRSTGVILDAINSLFRKLMRRGGSDVVYDSTAELRLGRKPDRVEHHPVEVHLLERFGRHAEEDEEADEPGLADLSDPMRWTPIEREAYLIGQRINAMVQSGQPTLPAGPIRYRDVVVLLRSTKINAGRMAAILNSMGVPAHADIGGSLFAAREVRDVLAAMQVLDNLQQDIPLAAVLRSGILGGPLSEDDLVALRCLDRDIPFHAAVREFAKRGEDVDLRERLGAILNRINRFRADANRRPLAEVLWALYERSGYLAYAGGLPGGRQRRANLLKLHQLARQFGSFRRQGLHRFLRFVESLDKKKQDVATAPAAGESEDVVRVMSIHKAKGLEFPVVFVAGLGTKFNLGDRSGRMIFERGSKIGLRVVDPEQMIDYPSAAHKLASLEIEKTTRDEELRILYVAMTRARDMLVLVGSQRKIERYREPGRSGEENVALSALAVATAAMPLDWLMPVLRSLPGSDVRGLGGGVTDRPLFDVQLHDVAEMMGWRETRRAGTPGDETKRAVAKCEVLPDDEPLAPDDATVEQVLSRVGYVYPYTASTAVRASIAASEFKGAFDFQQNPEERPGTLREHGFRQPPSKYGGSESRDATVRGVVTHRVLQHMDFTKALDEEGVALNLERMIAEGLIPGDAMTLVDVDSLVWFVSTPLAEAIRRCGDAYRREFPYVTTESVSYFDRGVSSSAGDHVLVRGIVDGILPGDDGIEIVDYKTDAIRPEEVDERSARYQPQMELYARAMGRIWRWPVRTCWLVFLGPRRLMPRCVSPATD